VRLTGLRRSTHEADVVVAGSGLPPLVTALELARRGARVIVAREDPDGAPPPLGLMLQGPGRPYAAVARAISRPAAQVVWAAGCENHLRAKAFLQQAGRPCGFEARGSFLLARDRRQAEELEESEDLLRDDGFPGEFLDHFMLETRFDLSGFPAGYWAAGDAELDVSALDEALRDAVGDAGVAFATGRLRGLRPEASSVRVELETRSLTGAAAVVASDGPVAALVPELAPLVALATLARVSIPPLEGANLPTAVRTADGSMAWHSSGGAFLLAEIAPRPPGDAQALRELATRLPLALAPTHRGPDVAPPEILEESVEVSRDGLPLVGLLPGRPLAVACGFGRLSPGLAFAAARWVADALLRGTDPTPDALRATRAPGASAV
jgi:glycine/D-amino acid oxidase-like deaminating enzyme